MTGARTEEARLCSCAFRLFCYHQTVCERGEKEGEGLQESHTVKQTVELFTIIMMMQEDELENTVEENTLAENLIPLNSHPATRDNWNGISSYPKELRRGLRLYFQEKPKCCLKSFQTGRVLWYVMFWFSSFCYHSIFPSVFIYIFILHKIEILAENRRVCDAGRYFCFLSWDGWNVVTCQNWQTA